jgi:hypothetical protein
MLLESSSSAAAPGSDHSKIKEGKKTKKRRVGQHEGWGSKHGHHRRGVAAATTQKTTKKNLASYGSRGDEASNKKRIQTSDLHGDGVSSDDDDGNDASMRKLLPGARASKMLRVDREVRAKQQQQQQQQRKRSRTNLKASKVPSKRRSLPSSSHLASRMAASSCTLLVGCGRSSAALALRTDHHVPTATQALIRQRKEQRMMEEITRSLRGVVAKPATSSKSKTMKG